MKILLTESIAKEFVDNLRSRGFEVEEYLGHTQEEIEEHIKGAHALIVRSATKVNKKLLDNADCLKVVGRAGTGVDNIDIPECTSHGVIALNTPTANNMAAGELAVTMAHAIFRNLIVANEGVHNGDFRRGQWSGVELEGKNALVIGVGRIGSIVSRKLKGVGMKVYGYDPFIPAEKFDKLGITRCETLEDGLKIADLITLHTPKTKDGPNKTYNMIANEEIYKCKRGVRIVNCARGGLVNEQDLADALADGQVAAAGVDVFDVEPSYNRAPGEQEFDNVLLHAPNCVITPHLGASTQEATYNVGSQVSDLVARALEGELVPALNLPSISGDMEAIRPYTVLAEKIGLMYFQTETTPIKKISVTYRGELAAQSTELVTMSLLMGVLKGMGNDHASYVNVQENIEECGIEVEENSIEKIEKYNNLVVVKFTNEEGRELKINGTAFGETPVIVNFFGYAMNCPLFETVLAIKNNDVPGVIGRIATVLGRHNINIAAMNWGRKEGDENNNHAQAFVAVETPVNDKIIKEIEACDGVLKVSLIDFS